MQICRYEKYGLEYVTFPEFQDKKIIHAFSTRHGGVSEGYLSSLNLSHSRGDKEENVRENYRRLAEALGLSYENFIGCRQLHGSKIELITRRDLTEKRSLECDGLITSEPGIVLVTVHADCVPIYLYDPETPAVGMVHSGWKGTVEQIAAEAVKKMKSTFGTRPEKIRALLGPCICGRCFEVREDVKSIFVEKLPWSAEYIVPKDQEHWTVDLKAIIKNSLISEGVPGENILDAGICTAENTRLFYSHRHEKGKTGTMAALIALADNGQQGKKGNEKETE